MSKKKKRELSAFEKRVKRAPAAHVAKVKEQLRVSYFVAQGQQQRLWEAIEALDTEPGFFLNLNPVFREIIEERLGELAGQEGGADA